MFRWNTKKSNWHFSITIRLEDAIRDGLRDIKNAIEDMCLIPGAGAF